MYEITTTEFNPENFFAGSFPIAKDVGAIKTGATINRHAPLVKGATGIIEADSESLDDLIGIAAAAPSGGKVVYYLTGEFFADALHLPTGVTVEALKPAFRKLGIFLKEVIDNG